MEVFVVNEWESSGHWYPVAAFSSLSAAAVYLSDMRFAKRNYVRAFHVDCHDGAIVTYSFSDLVERGLLEE